MVRGAVRDRAEHLRGPLQGLQGVGLAKEIKVLSHLREGSVEHERSAVFAALFKGNGFLEGPPIDHGSDL